MTVKFPDDHFTVLGARSKNSPITAPSRKKEKKYAIVRTGEEWNNSVRTTTLVSKSQMAILPSKQPVANRVPNGLKDTDLIVSHCKTSSISYECIKKKVTSG